MLILMSLLTRMPPASSAWFQVRPKSRRSILPVAVNKLELIVATSEPFIRGWADELEKILHLRVKLVFANPGQLAIKFSARVLAGPAPR